jgi:hypothetical protein
MGQNVAQHANLDRSLENDPRFISTALKCNRAYRRPSRICPHSSFQQNTFSALGESEDDDNDVKTVATQVTTLTYQSQLTASTATNTSIRQEQQLAHLALQQSLMHENMHQLIDGLNAVEFNISDEGRGVERYAPWGNYSRGYSGRSQRCGCTSARGRPFAPNAYGSGFPTSRSVFPTAFPTGGHFQGFMPPRPPQGFPQAPPIGPSPGLGPPPGLGPQPYCAPIAQGSTYVAPGMPHAHIQQQLLKHRQKTFQLECLLFMRF